MAQLHSYVFEAVLLDDATPFSLAQLVRACGAERDALVELVQEGVLAPEGAAPDDWRFDAGALARARKALRLQRDLQLGPGGTALVLQLLDEIAQLRRQLERAGPR